MNMRIASIVAIIAIIATIANSQSVVPTVNGVGSIIAITALELETMMNYMVLYPASNATIYAKQADYPYYEYTTASAIDLVRGRYLVMYESEVIGFYNISTLEKLGELQLPDFQIPDCMHYDASTDLIWLINVGVNSFQFCSVDNTGSQSCYGLTQGHYSYTADATALDAVAGKLYVQLGNMDSMKNGKVNEQPLFVFDLNTQQVTGPIPMGDLCLNMEIAVVRDKRLLVCADFIFNILVSVDPSTGKFTKIAPLSGAPQPYTSVTDNSVAGRSTYYIQLEGIAGTNRWTAWDVETGRQLFNTTNQFNWQLSLPQFIPA